LEVIGRHQAGLRPGGAGKENLALLVEWKGSMSENEIIDSGIELPRIAAVEPLPPSTLRVVWAEGRRAGREDFVDVRPIIYSYKIYKPLRDEALFATGRLVDEDAVAWDGEDLENVCDMIQSLAGRRAPKDFAFVLAKNSRRRKPPRRSSAEAAAD
jgi:hypothetical protein